MRLFVILLYASMETLLAFMNHFPLFAIVLRVKDPWRLSGLIFNLCKSAIIDWLTGGIYFLYSSTPFSTDPSLIAKVRILTILPVAIILGLHSQNQPVPLSSIFFQYSE